MHLHRENVAPSWINRQSSWSTFSVQYWYMYMPTLIQACPCPCTCKHGLNNSEDRPLAVESFAVNDFEVLEELEWRQRVRTQHFEVVRDLLDHSEILLQLRIHVNWNEKVQRSPLSFTNQRKQEWKGRIASCPRVPCVVFSPYLILDAKFWKDSFLMTSV